MRCCLVCNSLHAVKPKRRGHKLTNTILGTSDRTYTSSSDPIRDRSDRTMNETNTETRFIGVSGRPGAAIRFSADPRVPRTRNRSGVSVGHLVPSPTIPNHTTDAQKLPPCTRHLEAGVHRPASPWRLQEHTRYVTPRHTRRHPRVQPPSSRPSASWRDRVSSRRAGRVSRPSGALRGCPACPILCVQRSPAAHQAAGHVDQGGARYATHTPARLHSHDDHWRRPRRPQPR